MKLIKYFFLFIILSVCQTAFSQNSAELKRRKEALTREIESLNRSINKTSTNKRSSLKQIKLLNTQIRLREAKINTINSEVRLLNNEISENTNTVRSLELQLKKLKEEYAGMVLFAFRNQSAYSKLMFLFASGNFNQAYKRLKYLQQFSEYRKKQARYIEDTEAELNGKIVQLDRNKREKGNLLNSQQNEKKTLGKEKNNQSTVLSKLSKQEKTLRKELLQRKKENDRLNRAIQQAIRREIEEERRRAEAAARAAAARAKAENKAPSSANVPRGSGVLAATPESAKLSADFLSNRGRLPWPVSNGIVTEGFGIHRYGKNVSSENNGIDIKTNPGATVRAVFEGEVTGVQNIGNIYVVVIRHGEYFTVYSNLKSASVSRGQKVSVKQTLGTVITDPVDGTTEAHFEVWKGVTPVNPSSWLAN
ncbi:MAG TPA: peptidoglycan DD-metalloendopeptidase family protein [Sphingobacteriaceae bacterium]|nr:peptidoglycan DD-metalloendopeptidase family protein [Sphingobacteriaceae bacterium]